ncbi:MAG: hypothetical protein JJE36_05465 [Coriobacteriia bacterium]|nr:hypothetical protein [Coriobacteriia bacterium]
MTATFRGTFTEAGTKTVTVEFVEVATGTVLGSKDIAATVAAANSKPVAANQGPTSVTVGTTYSLDLSTIFTDADSDAMTYSLVSYTTAELSPSLVDGKTVTYTPSTNDAGKTVIITVKANDGKEDSANVTITLTVNS